MERRLKIGTKFSSRWHRPAAYIALRQHGVLEAVRDVADRLQRAAGEPPGHRGHGAGVRLGANPAGRGAAVPAAQQPET